MKQKVAVNSNAKAGKAERKTAELLSCCGMEALFNLRKGRKEQHVRESIYEP